MKYLLCTLFMIVGLTSCRSAEQHAPSTAGLTDEDIILRCRSHTVAIAHIDEELGDWIQWQNLKAKLRPGDEIWQFSTPGPSWEDLMGWAGYAAFRDGKLIGVVTTEEN
jgi:hypothetical protein